MTAHQPCTGAEQQDWTTEDAGDAEDGQAEAQQLLAFLCVLRVLCGGNALPFCGDMLLPSAPSVGTCCSSEIGRTGRNPVIRVDPTPQRRWGRPERLLSKRPWGRPKRLHARCR